jgi:hypothetical protein
MASIHEVYIKLSLGQLGAYSFVDTLALEQREATPARGVPVLHRLISLPPAALGSAAA